MKPLQCDNQDAERVLIKLGRQVVAAGGWFHDSVGFSCLGGNLGIMSSLGAEVGDVLASLPLPCLLPLKKIRIGISGDDLIIASHDGDLPAPKLAMFEAMLELYNLTGKIASHRATSPWLALGSDPELLKYLARGRPAMQAKGKKNPDGSPETVEDMTVRTFIHTRYLNYKGPNPVLMPFIDFANHHTLAAGYLGTAGRGEGAGLALLNSKPVAGSEECFVQYQLFDALDMYLIYGYVERTTPFVRSIPMKINLHGLGVIDVQALQTGRAKGKLPAKAADLRPYLPKALELKDGNLKISHLIIPDPQAGQALQRVLSSFIKKLGPDLDLKAIGNYVREAEYMVLRRNKTYYQTLLRRLAQKAKEAKGAPSSRPHAMAANMARVQLGKLRQYTLIGQGQGMKRLLG